MAKYSKYIEYDIRLFDHIVFEVNGRKIYGVVQCLQNFPDSIWVETGCPDIEWNGDPYDLIGYRRWEVTLNQIDFTDDRTNCTEYDKSRVDFKMNEELEFVYSEDCKTREVCMKYSKK